MTTANIRERLHHFIDTTDDKKVKAIYTILEDNIEEQDRSSDHWQDTGFVAEMEGRYNDYKKGKAQLVSLEETEKKAKRAAKHLKVKKAS